VDATKLWIGLGAAISGSFIVNGVTFTKGTVYCCGDPDYNTRWASVFITDLSFGLGLGASAGFVALIGLNYASPSEMTEKIEQFRDFEFALDLGLFSSKAVSGILGDLSKISTSAGVMQKVANVFERGTHFRENNQWVTAFGDAFIKDAQNTNLDTGKKRIIAVALPECGLGLGLYAGAKGTDTKVISWGSCDRRVNLGNSLTNSL